MKSSRLGTFVFYGFLAAVAAMLVSASGCSSKNEEPKHRTIKGTVLNIDASSGQVEMLWYNPKEKQERKIVGKLAPDAEILINGKTARLEDVTVNDKVAVTGRVEKHDGQPSLVAVKVDIRRPTTRPASAPASRPKA